jgi:hypothetical protein
VIVFGECHLRHLLRSYLTYYNETRTHLGNVAIAVEVGGQALPALSR